MILKIKHKDIWYYNPQCLISGGLMLDEIIMNLGPIFNGFNEDNNSLSKIGNMNFFFPFCLLKQAPSFLIAVKFMNSLS